MDADCRQNVGLECGEHFIVESTVGVPSSAAVGAAELKH